MSFIIAILGLFLHIFRRIIYPNPTIIEFENSEEVLLLPSSRKITIEDEPESKTCSIVERQALDQYRAKLARELENFEPIKVEEISL